MTQSAGIAGCATDRRWKWLLTKLLVFAVLLLFTYRGALQDLGQRLLGGPGPTATVVMQLKWGADYILGRVPEHTPSIFAFPIYYPYQNSFVLSDTMLGNQPIWLPLYVLCANPVLATNLWVFICHALSFFMFALYIERSSLTKSTDPGSRRWAGLLCGALFAFSGYRLDRHMHLQLMPQFWTPVALLLLDRAASRPRLYLFLGLSVALAAQWLAGTHLGMIACILVVLTSIYHLRGTNNRKRLFVALAATAASVALLLSPLLVRSIAALNAGLHFETKNILNEAPGPAAIARASTWDRAARAIGIPTALLFHQALFPGFALSVLLITAYASLLLRPRGRGYAWVCAGAAALLLYLATGHEPVIRSLPLFAALRRPGRLALGALVPGLVLIANSTTTMLSRKTVRVVSLTALAILLAETGLRETRTGTYLLKPNEAFEAVLQRSRWHPVLLLPQSVGTPNNPERAALSSIQMQLLSHSWVPGLAGRSGPRPPFVNSVTEHSLRVLESSAAAGSFVDRVRRLGYAAIVVMPESVAGRYCGMLEQVLNEPEVVAGTYAYFPLLKNPANAPKPENLDAGNQARRALLQGRFSVVASRLDRETAQLTFRLNRRPFGVVQRERVVSVPYTLRGPCRQVLVDQVRLVMNRVTDGVMLTASVRAPKRRGWILLVGGKRFDLATL